MTVYTSRFGFQWNYQAHDAGWGNDFNYTMRALAVLLDCYLTSDTVTTPPGSPAENDAYYVPATATGVWSTNTGKIAAFQGGAWQYYTPERGTRAYIASRSGFYWFNGTLWLAEATSGTGGGVLTVAGHSPDISGNVSLVVGDITGAAPLSSPALTGTPTTPNTTALSRSTQIANTKYVDDAVTAVVIAGAPVTSVATRTGAITLTHSDLTDWSSATSTFLTSSALSGYATTSSVTTSISTAIAALVNSAPGTMDTLGEIATLLAADESTASALATTVAGKVSKSGDTMTGALHLVAPGGSDNSDIAVSSAWVQTYVASLGFGTGSGTITGVTAGTGLTGGGASGAVTVSLDAIANNDVLANTSGSSAAPVATSVSALLDAAIASTRGDILYRGASTWSALAPGTSGNVLQTNGAGADPSWATPSTGGASAQIDAYTASTTWTKPTGAKSVTVIVFGGGAGGAGGVGGAAGTTRAGGSGGGGGARHEHTFAASDITATVAVTVGAAGAAGTGGSSGIGTAGGAGGQSSFGAYLSAFGGGAGFPNTATAGNSSGGGGGGVGGAGGAGANGSISGGAPQTTTGVGGVGGGGGGAVNGVNGLAAEYGGGGGGGYLASIGQGSVGGSSLLGGAGGGCGAGLTAANVVGTASAGGSVRTMVNGGGGAAGTSGGSGGAGTAGDSTKGGTGGGGGSASSSTAGGAGGVGGANGGGGGGGAGGTSTGGAGGAGGVGAVYVITYF